MPAELSSNGVGNGGCKFSSQAQVGTQLQGKLLWAVEGIGEVPLKLVHQGHGAHMDVQLTRGRKRGGREHRSANLALISPPQVSTPLPVILLAHPMILSSLNLTFTITLPSLQTSLSHPHFHNHPPILTTLTIKLTFTTTLPSSQPSPSRSPSHPHNPHLHDHPPILTTLTFTITLPSSQPSPSQSPSCPPHPGG